MRGWVSDRDRGGISDRSAVHAMPGCRYVVSRRMRVREVDAWLEEPALPGMSFAAPIFAEVAGLGRRPVCRSCWPSSAEPVTPQ